MCGKILGYQYRSPDAFGDHGRGQNLSIDSNYVDGVSLTYSSNPRKHIWTFAAALNELGIRANGKAVCPCSHPRRVNAPLLPAFIGKDYFCDSGIQNDIYNSQHHSTLLGDETLWDWSGCGYNSTCCSVNNPPWFYKLLPQTVADAIEMRVCIDEGRDIAISHGGDIY